jgi:DNA (cytosine-5)-methyltransferase 1
MRIVDLFSGAGGLTFGFFYSLVDGQFLQNPNCDIVFANENDTNAAKAFNLNFPNVEMINSDISALKEQVISNLVGSGEIDLIIGGPPCQSFTTIGRRKYDDKAKLYKQYIRMLKIIRPRMFIFENVKGILSMKDGASHSVIDNIVKKFKNIDEEFGYNVDYKILDAVNYSVPQFRERVFIVGIRRDQNLSWVFPENKNATLTIKSAIDDLPALRAGETIDQYIDNPNNDYQRLMRFNSESLTFHYAAPHGEKILTVINNLSQGQGRRDFNRLVDLGVIDEKFRLTSGYDNTYGRLVADKPCTTITHNMSTPSSLRCIHYTQNRALTPREGARIQSFPDWFQFYGTITDVKTQIGNAVPPLLAMALADKAYDVLGGQQDAKLR